MLNKLEAVRMNGTYNSLGFFFLYKVQFHIAAACIRKVYNDCVKNALNQSEAAAILDRYVTESALCLVGPLDLLGNPRRLASEVNLTCNDAYNRGAPLCGNTLKEMFLANRADTPLCRLVCHANAALSRNAFCQVTLRFLEKGTGNPLSREGPRLRV